MNQAFAEQVAAAKIRLLELHHCSGLGHIGGNFSCIDALLALHHCVMRPEDRFVLSKGHAAGALYVTLWSQGLLTDLDLATFAADHSALPAHPSGTGIPGLLFSTGSLGHGPSLSAGLALSAKHSRSARRVFCVCSDGEWQEGSCWEALIFAVHQQLDNLTILIDQNGLQGFGTTQEVISCADLTPRFAGFGADVTKVDGHDPDQIIEALSAAPVQGVPRIIILDTIKGNGLHFAGKLESHYLPLTDDTYLAARSTMEAKSSA